MIAEPGITAPGKYGGSQDPQLCHYTRFLPVRTENYDMGKVLPVTVM